LPKFWCTTHLPTERHVLVYKNTHYHHTKIRLLQWNIIYVFHPWMIIQNTISLLLNIDVQSFRTMNYVWINKIRHEWRIISPRITFMKTLISTSLMTVMILAQFYIERCYFELIIRGVKFQFFGAHFTSRSLTSLILFLCGKIWIFTCKPW